MPAECKALRPTVIEGGDCRSELGKEAVSLAWRPYQSLLLMIADEIAAKEQAA
jgi:hypothetical protein